PGSVRPPARGAAPPCPARAGSGARGSAPRRAPPGPRPPALRPARRGSRPPCRAGDRPALADPQAAEALPAREQVTGVGQGAVAVDEAAAKLLGQARHLFKPTSGRAPAGDTRHVQNVLASHSAVDPEQTAWTESDIQKMHHRRSV